MRKQGKSWEGHAYQFKFFCKSSTFLSHRVTLGQLGQRICVVSKAVHSVWAVSCTHLLCAPQMTSCHREVCSVAADDRKLLPLMVGTTWEYVWTLVSTWAESQEYRAREDTSLSCCRGDRRYRERHERCNGRRVSSEQQRVPARV